MKRARILLALLCAGLFALSACSSDPLSSDGIYHFDGAQQPPTLIPIDQRKPAANFSGDLLTGSGTYQLAKDAGGKITVVNFWGAWCGPCQVETPQFQTAYAQYKTKGVTFVGIDIKEQSKGLPTAFVQKYKIAYPIVYDTDGQTAVELGNIPAQGAPYTVVLDSRHRVAGVYLQRVQPKDLDSVLNTLIAEK